MTHLKTITTASLIATLIGTANAAVAQQYCTDIGENYIYTCEGRCEPAETDWEDVVLVVGGLAGLALLLKYL